MLNLPDLFKKVFSVTQKAAPTIFGMFRNQDLMQGSFTPAQYDQMARQGYGKCSSAYSAISLIVKNFAEIEWQVCDYSKGEDKKVVIDNWENKHFIEAPNPKSSAYSFRESLAGYYMIAGDCYVMPITNASGKKPVWFYPIRPSMVEPVADENGVEIKFYWVGQGIDRVKIPSYLMYHLKSFNPLSYIHGMSPLQAILQDIDLINSGKSWNVSLQQNMGKPSGIISAKQILGEQQFNRLEKQVRAKFQGSKNAGNVWIGDGDLSWNQTSINPTDVDWLEGLKYSKGEIAVNLGCPPELIGLSEQKTYSNVKEARRALYKETVIPLSKLVIDEANRWLKFNGWLPEHWFIEINYKSISGLEEDENDLYERLASATWLTDNEKRVKSGFEPDEKRMTWNLTEFEKQLKISIYKDSNSPVTSKQLNKLLESKTTLLLEEKSSLYKSNHVSIVNMDTKKDKEIVSNKIENDREKIEEEYIAIIALMLKREHAKVMSAISTAQADYMISVLASKAVDKTFHDWSVVIGGSNKTIAQEFAKETIEDIAGSLADIEAEMFNSQKIGKEITDMVDESIGDLIRDINTTSKDRIAKVVSKGIDEGKTIVAIAKDIDKLYVDDMTPNRSVMIARTETVRSSNAGSYFAALNSPVQLDKIWISIIDSRTRRGVFNHAHPDGQKVGINELFTISNEKMRYAGDPSLGASAGNLINCRCSQGYSPAKKQN